MPSVAFSGNYINVMEGNSGRTQVNLTLFLSAASTNPVTVTYTTMLKTWGTATAGVDYIAKGQSEVTFLPGEVTKQISFEVLGDTLYEADEYFYVDLISASGATVVIEGAEGQRSPWQAVWIRNDDLATSLPNVIKGTLANETWRSTLENDQIDGGAGSDIVIWADTAKNYTLNFVSGQCIGVASRMIALTQNGIRCSWPERSCGS
jgi:chitinase